MAGIYIHIPFCHQACRYCNFHFSVSLWQKQEIVQCIIQEIQNRKHELEGEEIETIYFGGGTPSILDPIEISGILKAIHSGFLISRNAEITVEANPEDLKVDYLKELNGLGINRLSIGIQSFHDKDLEMMKRIHKAYDAVSSVENAQKSGFNNINIDLIYGLPWQRGAELDKNLDIALSSGVQHISAYHLTFEPGTVFDHWRKKGRLSMVDDEQGIFQMEKIIERLSHSGYDHYEISNFALPGYISRHNTNYWRQIKYSGFGPSAHSYDGMIRRWNIRNNLKYIEMVKGNSNDYFEYENLTKEDLYNEYVLTSLRTKWGIDLQKVDQCFGKELSGYLRGSAQKFISGGQIRTEDAFIKLTRKGIFLADYIISELMIV